MIFLVKTLILLHCFIFVVTGNEDYSIMSELDPNFVVNITNENFILELLTVFNRPEVALKMIQNIYFSENVSAKCIDDFKAFGIGLIKRKAWAIEMLDAYGKIESGITQGNIVWPGRISVCKNVVQKFPNNYSGFRGQFCWLEISPKAHIIKKIDKKYVKLRLGICIPDSCTSNDLNFLLQSIVDLAIPSMSKYVNVSVTCIPYTRNIWEDKQAVICLMFLFMTATIILSGTSYNVYTQYFVELFSKSLNKQNCEIEADIEIQTESRENFKNGLEFELKPESIILLHEENDKSFNTNNKVSQIWKKILLCFSLYSNGIKLFNCKSEENSLKCLNGIRVLSMFWIILGHVYIICLQSQPNNVIEIGKFANTSFWFSIIIGALFSVDTFFVLSGILITFLYLKKIEKENENVPWLTFYFHRYFRLTPVYAVVIIVLRTISPYYSNSPLWPQNGLNNECKKYWWANLLYINNFLPMSTNCFNYTWFLAVYMQFIFISPLLLLLLKRSTLMFSVLAGCLILTGWITTGTIASYNHLKYLMQNKNFSHNTLILLYEKPYCRIDTYIIGMICGYLLYRSKGQITLNKKIVILNWLIAAVSSFSVIFGTYQSHAPQATQSLYFALSRSAWAIAVSWMIYACCNGYGGFINRILSWSLWQPLSRLTYSIYLIHTTIIHLLFQTSEITTHFSNMQIFINFIASTVYTCIAAILLSLSFEAPFIGLEKLMLQKKITAVTTSLNLNYVGRFVQGFVCALQMEVNKLVGNLQNKSLAELHELLERQEKLLANVKLLKTLKDQGKSSQKLREKIKEEIDNRKLDTTTNLLEKLEISSNDDTGLVRAENKMSIKPAILETLANNEETNTLNKKTIQSKKNVSFYSKLSQVIDAKENNKKLEKPNRPKPMNVQREGNKSTPKFEEESAVRYPVGPHKDGKLISLQESFGLLKESFKRIKKNQHIEATNSLMQTNSIKMSDYFPDPVANMSYREVTDIDSDLDLD